MNKLLRDTQGGALVEFTLVFPVFILVALGTVDFTFLLFDRSMAAKAAYQGARTAIVTSPVASNITNLTYDPLQIGQWCFDPGTGGPSPTANCPSASSVCTPNSASSGSCTNSQGTFDNTAFTTILNSMQAVFPRVQRQNVQISYQTTGLGFAGRPAGLPMDVTVSITCMNHQFYFIGALMGFAFPALPAGCPAANPGPIIPPFSTTLPSEDMVTN